MFPRFLCVAVFGVLVWSVEADARTFRVAMLPSAPASCNTCHTTGGGTPLNAFGQAVLTRVTPAGREVFWGPELAALDSDGDGFTNGQELGDPDGDGVVNTPLAQTTNPGDPNSFPLAQNQARLTVTVTQNGTPVAGATVAVTRSISGVAENYAWSETTNASGQAAILISVDGRSASGYYRIRATSSAGAVIGTAGSIPVNGGRSATATVSAGAIAALRNVPNPFNPATQIHYALDAPGAVQLTVYNALGQTVAQLVNTQQAVGSYAVTWDAKEAASGLYYYRLTVDGQSEIRKMLLLK